MDDNAPAPRRKPTGRTPLYGLRAHNNGKWYRKIPGVGFRYFGRWEDPAGADRAFGRWAEQMGRGQEPTPDPSVITLAEVVDRYLTRQEQRVTEGEIGVNYFAEVKGAVLSFNERIGGRVAAEAIPDERLAAYREQLLKRVRGHAANRELMAVRAMLRWAKEDANLIRVPAHKHRELRRVTKQTIRQETRELERKHGTPLFRKGDVRRIVAAAGEPLRLMVLLALNAGLSQKEIAALVWADLDLDRGLLSTIRPKTKVLREAALWPYVVVLLREWQGKRPKAKDSADADRIFLTRWGRPYAYTRVEKDEDGAITKVVRVETITGQFNKLLDRIDKDAAEGEPKLRQHGRNFRALRRTFRTIAEGANTNPKRLNAIRRIMGHETQGNDPSYMRRMPHGRLRRICLYVAHRLFSGWSCSIAS